MPTAFAVILLAVALLVVQTFELNFEVILYIHFFCFVKPRKLLKFAICIQNPLDSGHH